LDYEPETGVLRWKKSCGSRAKAGAIAGTINSKGYLTLKFRGFSLQAHRVAFAIYHGRWPIPCCDHINGRPTDNTLANLRECTLSDNQHNSRAPRNNTTGIKGVCQSQGGYRAYVQANSVNYSKRFRHLEDAAAWVKQTREQLHGEFARH
jgi:hypothetical protein